MMRKLVTENCRRAKFVRGLDGSKLFHEQGLVTVRFVDQVFLFDESNSEEDLVLNHGYALGVAQDQGIYGFFLLIGQVLDLLPRHGKQWLVLVKRVGQLL